jgi:hypothetical protein
MFETLTLLTLLTISFFVWQNKQLGLTSTVPKDPGARAHWQASQCLESFKKFLSGATIKHLDPNRVEVLLKDSEDSLEFWCEAGKVFKKAGEAQPEQIHFLGPSGSLAFRMLSPQALFAKIVADSGSGAHHEVGVRLEVKSEGLVAQPA